MRKFGVMLDMSRNAVMKPEEVKRFATLKEIDISETKNANEAKALIKEFLEEIKK